MARDANEFLAQDSSDESDNESGYDSEAAEIAKSSKSTAKRGSEHARKRRKLSHSSESEDVSEDSDVDLSDRRPVAVASSPKRKSTPAKVKPNTIGEAAAATTTTAPTARDPKSANSETHTKQQPSKSTPAPLPSIHNAPELSDPPTATTKKKTKTHKDKSTRPGVIYLSSLPPYLRPSALRNLLQQRGFGPIPHLFLTPAASNTTTSKNSSSSASKTSRKLYTEGWITLPTPSQAKLCASTLNATPIGGKKGMYYRDDLWNMRYLKGVSWEELMEGVRGERAEEEARRVEERREIEKSSRRFVAEVGEGRRWDGMRERERERGKKRRKGGEEDEDQNEQENENGGQDVQRTWRQFEVKKDGAPRKKSRAGGHGQEADQFDAAARETLARIF